MPLQSRVTLVQSALAQLLAENGTGPRANPFFDAGTIRVNARRAGQAVVLDAVDRTHADPLPIVTVMTLTDKQTSAVWRNSRAWQAELQNALVKGLMRRQPAVERRSMQSVVEVLAALLALSFVLWVRAQITTLNSDSDWMQGTAERNCGSGIGSDGTATSIRAAAAD